MTEFIKKTCLSLIICGNHEDDHVEWSELIQAIEQAQTKEMVRILNKDPQLIYITDMVGETALHAVARAGHAQTASKIMQFIGSRDKVLLKKNIDGETALHLALKNRHQETAYHLVDLFRMAVSLVNNDGVSPWDLAEEAGYSDVLGRMSVQPLAGIADIEMTLVRRDIIDFDESQRKWIGNIGCMRLSNVKDAFFQSAFGVRWERLWLEMDRFGGNLLHIAARLDRVDLLKLVVQFMTSDELGSLPFERNKDDDTALDLALKAKHKNAAMYLIELAPKCSYLLNRFGVSPLYRTIELGDEDLVRYIFQLMPGNAMDSSTRRSLLKAKMSVVHAAVKSRNNLGILEILMEELPDCIECSNEQGWKALSYAAYEGYLDKCRYILKKFPEAARKNDRDGSFPIHKAVGAGHVYIVEEFLSSCPSTIYDVDRKGRTILHLAVRYARADVFSYLTKKEQVKNIFHFKDHKGRTFIDLAQHFKNCTNILAS